MNRNHRSNSNPKITITGCDNDVLEELQTPYFRKSVSYAKNQSDDAAEEKINNFLEGMGVYFVEKGDEAFYLARNQLSINSANRSINKQTSLSDLPVRTSRLSSLNMSNNDLFQKRKLSAIRSSQDL